MKFWHNLLSIIKTFIRKPSHRQDDSGQQSVVRKPRYVTLEDIYAKHYDSKLDYTTFERIVQIDPSYDSRKPDKMGKFGKWLLSLHLKGNLLQEDYDKARRYLDCFDLNRRRLGGVDLNRIKSLPDLYDLIKDYIDSPDSVVKSDAEIEREIKATEAERLYEDDEWIIIHPLTQNAAVIYGRGTQWCTAATTSYNYFESYNSRGPLHILISKKTGRKYQFHLASHTYCDETDRAIPYPVAEFVGMSVAVATYYQSVGWFDLFDDNGWNRNENHFLKLGDRYCLFTPHHRMVIDMDVDSIVRYIWGPSSLYVVKKNNRYNALWADESRMIFEDWYDDIKILSPGIFILHNQKDMRIYSLSIGIFLDEYLSFKVADFGKVCNDWALETIKSRGEDISSFDDKLFPLVEDLPDYMLYLKLFGKKAIHYKQARYKITVPTIQSIALLLSVVGFLIMIMNDPGVLKTTGFGVFVLSFISLLAVTFSLNFFKNLWKLITFLTVTGMCVYMLFEFGPAGFFCFIGSFSLILFITGMISKICKRKGG